VQSGCEGLQIVFQGKAGSDTGAENGVFQELLSIKRKALCASLTNRSTFSLLLRPDSSSTPVWVSTPAGRTASIASYTLSAVKPPARMTGLGEHKTSSRLTAQ